MEPRKPTTRTPTRLTCAEGNMDRSDRASFCSVRRGRRPHGTPGNFLHENRETSAGEGSGRTARVYVCEESHCGIVPMNHSHKDKQSSGESGEGRLRIKENTFPFDTYPTQCGTARVLRVGECADKLFAWPLIICDKNRMR
jgi:hypothetical protein